MPAKHLYQILLQTNENTKLFQLKNLTYSLLKLKIKGQVFYKICTAYKRCTNKITLLQHLNKKINSFHL